MVSASTIPRAGARQAAKASANASLSLHENQKGRLRDALPRARGHGVVCIDHVGKAGRLSSRLVWPRLPVDLARLRGRALFHSRSDALTSSGCIRQRACLILPGQARAHSVASRVSSTARLNTLAHEHFFHRLAHVPHVLRLSSSLFSSGIDPNENGLTHEAQPLSPRGKTHV